MVLTRTPFGDIEYGYGDYELRNEAGNVLYRSGGPCLIIARFCRDFACTAIVLKRDGLAKAVIDVAKKTGVEHDILESIRHRDVGGFIAPKTPV